MRQFKYIVQDELGLHARPAGIMAKEIKTMPYSVKLEGNKKSADGAKIMSIMAMGIKKGMEVTVTVEGEEEGEEEAAKKLEQFFREHF
jgi:Phosphotransferase System HPr (HPr) Family